MISGFPALLHFKKILILAPKTESTGPCKHAVVYDIPVACGRPGAHRTSGSVLQWEVNGAQTQHKKPAGFFTSFCPLAEMQLLLGLLG